MTEIKGTQLLSPLHLVTNKDLDARRESFKTFEDLRYFNFEIPEGFEVYVGGAWFTYASSNTVDPVSGKFRLRASGGGGGGGGSDLGPVITKNMEQDERLAVIETKLFPMSLNASMSPGGVHEKGNTIEFTITGALVINGKEIADSSYYVNNAPIERPYKTSAKDSVSFTFKGVSPTGQTLSRDLSATFSNRYYWDVVNVGWIPSNTTIKALRNNQLSTPTNLTKSFSPANQLIAFVSLSEIKSIKDSNGFDNINNFNKYNGVPVTNQYGVTYNTYVYVLKAPVTQTNFNLTFNR